MEDNLPKNFQLITSYEFTEAAKTVYESHYDVVAKESLELVQSSSDIMVPLVVKKSSIAGVGLFYTGKEKLKTRDVIGVYVGEVRIKDASIKTE